MKIKQLIPLVLLPFMMFSCKEKLCDTPCESPYAPETASISWTDYNSVRTILDYFHCHPSTIKEHAGDTIKVKGWLYYGEPGVDPMIWHESELDYSYGFTLTANSDHNGYYDQGRTNTIRIGLGGEQETDTALLVFFREHLDVFSPKQLFITGKIRFLDIPPIKGCCYRWVSLSAIEIDTNTIQ